MVTPLLHSKLYVPPPRSEWVPRPHLLERLDAGMRCKFTLISAPAGFGKTSLLSVWSATHRPHVAWVSLDPSDNDPALFWAYAITALQGIAPGLGQEALAAFRSAQPPQVETILAGLINEIGALPERAASTGQLFLILDDYHVVTTPQVHTGLSFFLEHLPPPLHLVLSTRADPPWALGRLRARGEMVELRAADLRFTPKEVSAFLNETMELGLSAEEIAALDTRTEGWAAGLQLAALSMRGSDSSTFIQAFSGSHRFVLDYLVEEVLDQQPADVRDFLLKTALIERLSAPLCNAITGRTDSQRTLASLEKNNLFLVPLDDERCWYRYHHLFADLLKARLQQEWPDQVPVLHRQASEWYEKNGLVAGAVAHALSAQDIGRVARLLDRNALAILDHGESAALLRWLEELPEEVVRARPWLCVAYAWILVYTGHLDAAEPLLQSAQEALAASQDLEQVQGRHIAGHIAAIRSYVVHLEGNWARAAELARESLSLLPGEDSLARGFAATTLSVSLRASGNLEAAAQALIEALQASRATDDSHVAVTALCGLAGLQAVQGQLRRAANTCVEALQLADEHLGRSGWHLPAAGYAHARMSLLQYEWNDLGSAVYHARRGVELCRQGGLAEILADSACYLAIALQAAGDAAGALEAMQEARRIGSRLSTWYSSILNMYEADIRLNQGNLAEAVRLTRHWKWPHHTVVRVLYAQGQLDQALQMLAQLRIRSETEGTIYHLIKALCLQALVLQAQGHTDQALVPLERALSLAEPENYVRVFVDEGQPMAQLLRQAAARGVAPDYVGRLLDALEGKGDREIQPAQRPAASMPEPLSSREMEVLRLLAAGLSNKEIAQTLTIALSTAKKHLGNIYGKLGSHNRTQAAAQAREHGLL